MSAELISVLALVACFVIATTLSVNMGLLAFAAAFLVGTFAGGLTEDQIFQGFPGEIFVVLVGVTYLFGLARSNGTTDWLVHWAVRLVGGRLAVIPWVIFAIGAVLTAVGAVSPAACAIVAPIALNLAARHRINPLLMGAMVVHGTQAGSFSPTSVYGAIVNDVVVSNHLPGDPVFLFLGSLLANVLAAAVVFVLLGGLRLTRGGAEAATSSEGGDSWEGSDSEPAADEGVLRLTRDRVLTLLGLAVLVVSTLVFRLDVGLVAVTVSVLLTVASPKSARGITGEITWSTVLLICGVLTYVGVLKEIGTIDYVGHSVAGVGVPLLAALLLCYIGGVVSAFASSVGLLGALIPLSVPFLAQGSIGAVGMVTALSVAATIVDISPFSTNGAIVAANVKGVDRDVFFRKLLIYGGIVVAVAPMLAWLVFVVPNPG